MKTISDTVHGSIALSDIEISILDTPEMQRLRRIRQLGFTYLVYPSATHTRFEHSLGTLSLADQLGKQLDLSKDEIKKSRLAALLHDVGHGPFSHSTEHALSSKYTLTHEDNTQKLVCNTVISEHVEEAGFEPREIAEIARGKKPPLGQLLSGEIDVDRMDYLVRDAYYTGVAYGVIDLDRLLRTASIQGDKLAFKKDGLSAVEALVLARYLMHPTVYSHHTARVAGAMFAKAVMSCLESNVFDVEKLYRMDDYDLLSKIKKNSGFAGELIRWIENRSLYKRALVLDTEELGDNYTSFVEMSKNPEGLAKLENELLDSTKLESGEILIDIPQPLYTSEAEASILWKDEAKKLHEVSPLAKALKDAQWRYWNVSVYCAAKHLDKVSKAAKEILFSYVL